MSSNEFVGIIKCQMQVELRDIWSKVTDRRKSIEKKVRNCPLRQNRTSKWNTRTKMQPCSMQNLCYFFSNFEAKNWWSAKSVWRWHIFKREYLPEMYLYSLSERNPEVIKPKNILNQDSLLTDSEGLWYILIKRHFYDGIIFKNFRCIRCYTKGTKKINSYGYLIGDVTTFIRKC